MITKKMLLILHAGLLFHINMIQSATTTAIAALVSGATLTTATSLLLFARTPNSKLIQQAKDLNVNCVKFNQQVQNFLKEQEIEPHLQSALFKDQSNLSLQGEQITKRMEARLLYPWNSKYQDNFKLYIKDIEKCCADLQNNREQLELQEELNFFYFRFHDFKESDFNCNDNPDSVQNIAKNIMGETVQYPLLECFTRVKKTVSLWDKQHEYMPLYDLAYIAWLKKFQEKIPKSYLFRLEKQLFEVEKLVKEQAKTVEENSTGLRYTAALAIFAAIKPH